LYVFEASTRDTQPPVATYVRRNPRASAAGLLASSRAVSAGWGACLRVTGAGGSMFQQHRTRVEEVLYEKVATVWAWLEVHGWLALAVLIAIALAWPYVLAGYSRMRSKANAPSEFHTLRCLVHRSGGHSGGWLGGAMPREDAGGRGGARDVAGQDGCVGVGDAWGGSWLSKAGEGSVLVLVARGTFG